MTYLRWFIFTTSLTLCFTATGVWIESRLRGEPSAIAGNLTQAELHTQPEPPQIGSSQVVQATIQVLITGAVQKPGLYRLPAGQKLRDLLTLAGGPLPEARLSQLDLEQVLTGGQVINVPVTATSEANGKTAVSNSAQSEAKAPAKSRTTSAALPAKGAISLNRASLADIQRLPGVGPALGQRILDWRQAHGSFRKLDDLLEVKGIGPKKFAKLQGMLSL